LHSRQASLAMSLRSKYLFDETAKMKSWFTAQSL
jgi:hypothetical protein